MLRKLDQTVRPLWSPRRLVLLAFLLGLMLAGLVLTAAYTAHISVQSCQRVNHLEAVATKQLQRAETTLPTLAYYRRHPAELAQQRRAIQDEINAFSPERCTLL